MTGQTIIFGPIGIIALPKRISKKALKLSCVYFSCFKTSIYVDHKLLLIFLAFECIFFL